MSSTHWITTSTLAVELSLETGAIVRVRADDWNILDRPELGRTFQLFLPLADRRYNYADGVSTAPDEVRVSENGLSVTAHWSQVTSTHGGIHDIGVTTIAEVVDDRIQFRMELDNRSDLVIENAFYPDFGDVRPTPGSGSLEAFTYFYSSARRSSLWPTFDNQIGYWGAKRPTYAYNAALGAAGAPMVPFILLQDGTRGLYVGTGEPEATMVAWFAELAPGYVDSMAKTAPLTPTLAGEDAYLRFAPVHLPYVAPGTKKALVPIVVSSFEGTWEAGADIYKELREDWSMPTIPAPSWMDDPHSWIQVQMNNPEDERTWTYADLPSIARDCAKFGVKAIQLTGWNNGGQDRNNPSHDADDALGGEQALREAIAECHELGVLIVLFTKFTWADRGTDWFRSGGIDDAIKDPNGDYYINTDYPYATISEYLQINTRKLVPMCFGSESYIRTCQAEFKKVLSLGAAGMLFDEAMHHTPATYCFSPDHGHAVPDFAYGHDRTLTQRLREVAGPENADFLFCSEAAYDWMFDSYQASYHRSEGGATSPFFAGTHTPLTRYMRPDAKLQSVAIGFDDRNLINQCLLYNYIISYEPYNFTGLPSDMPDTVAYGTVVDNLRSELREWFWDGSFRGSSLLSVTASGEPYSDYAAYEAKDGSLGVVIVNFGDTVAPNVQVARRDGEPVQYASKLVGTTDWSRAGSIEIPARSAVVLVPAELV